MYAIVTTFWRLENWVKKKCTQTIGSIFPCAWKPLPDWYKCCKAVLGIFAMPVYEMNMNITTYWIGFCIVFIS